VRHWFKTICKEVFANVDCSGVPRSLNDRLIHSLCSGMYFTNISNSCPIVSMSLHRHHTFITFRCFDIASRNSAALKRLVGDIFKDASTEVFPVFPCKSVKSTLTAVTPQSATSASISVPKDSNPAISSTSSSDQLNCVDDSYYEELAEDDDGVDRLQSRESDDVSDAFLDQSKVDLIARGEIFPPAGDDNPAISVVPYKLGTMKPYLDDVRRRNPEFHQIWQNMHKQVSQFTLRQQNSSLQTPTISGLDLV